MEESDEAHQDIAELRRSLKFIDSELAYLKTFNGMLLRVLKRDLNLKVPELDESQRQSEQDDQKQEKKLEHHLAPLCGTCRRPLQDDKESCIYCGMAVV